MRSLLIVPADEKRLAEALPSGADAVVIDLAQAAPTERMAARTLAGRFVKQAHGRGPGIFVGVNPLDSGEIDSDLDAVMAHAPDAILLPKSLGAASVQQLSAKLALREADFALIDGATRIIAVVDTAQALFGMGSYRGASARLAAIAWSVEALRADIGAETDRDPTGDYAGPYRLARQLTLLAAASARVAAIDTAFPNVGDREGLRAESLAARRLGFAGKTAIDPAQAGIINDAFALQSAAPRERSPP